MKRLIILALLATTVAGCKSRLLTTTQILDIDSGSKRAQTAPFNVLGTWDMTYSFDCQRQHTEGLKDLDRFDLTVYNSDDDSTSFESPEQHDRAAKGGQTVHYTRGGWYYIKVDSPCDWRLEVVQLGKG